MVVVVGFALLGLMVTPVRKQVFLLVITVITNVMHCMTTTAITVQKSGRRPFKKSAFGGEKIAACGSPSLTLPRGENANQKTSFPSCHHRHHQCHALHDDNSHHGSKSGRRPFKKSDFGGEKIAACGVHSLTPQGARMLTWCGSHSGCVGWMEHESRRVLNLRRCSIYLIIYVSLCMGGGIYGVSL